MPFSEHDTDWDRGFTQGEAVGYLKGLRYAQNKYEADITRLKFQHLEEILVLKKELLAKSKEMLALLKSLQ